MIELEGKHDIWKFHGEGHYIVIPINGSINTYRENVMGRGLALQAKRRYNELPAITARCIAVRGLQVFEMSILTLFMFPTKFAWKYDSDIGLIRRSCLQLQEIADSWSNIKHHDWSIKKIYMPRVGCGNGNLNWNDVSLILDEILDDRFIVVEDK